MSAYTSAQLVEGYASYMVTRIGLDSALKFSAWLKSDDFEPRMRELFP